MGPTHDAVASRAYEIWQSEGCPDGRAMEHWLRAVSELKRGTGEEVSANETREDVLETQPVKPRTGKRSTPRVAQGRI